MGSAFLIGLIIAAIPGPATMLFMQHVFEKGMRVGLWLGLGITMADILYALIAGIGFSLVSHFLFQYQNLLQGSSGVFLIGLGIYECITKKQITSCNFILPFGSSALGAFIVGFLVILFNPLTILMFAGIFSSFSHIGLMTMIIGIFFGSMAWWVALGYVFKFLKKQITPFGITVVQKAAGVGLIALGLTLLYKVQ